MARAFAPVPFAPHASVNASRYLIVPCEADGCSDLAVIWDRLEEQVIDVISAAASHRYSDEDALWDEARGWTDTDLRMAA
ncbi:hypothetical protein [Brevundimonas sp.]|uniref:hypothetical protein n=1 Tax=Brevundimonas sp. TaxID=1871086 RepID=UPI001A240F3B|nr:hypothetical protein [Brevundimonas sp.]MBJ7484089.1 hypothetical protein [Brevundimonas sp.]